MPLMTYTVFHEVNRKITATMLLHNEYRQKKLRMPFVRRHVPLERFR